MARTVIPFGQRLATARQLMAAGWAGSHLSHIQDQLEAAADESKDQLHLLGFVATLAEPERGWRQRSEIGDPEQRAVLLAAMLDCMPARCPHLRKGEPQPAYALLPLRRIDCRRCVGTWRRPPLEDSDRCDVCGARDVSFFVPFAVAVGPTLIAGDACSSCAGVLGIHEAAA
jgi:hypothetical protein